MIDKHLTQAPVSEFLFFQSDDGRARVECRFQSDTLWLTQTSMAELYDEDVRTINGRLINIFTESETAQISTARKFRIVHLEGKRQVSREIDLYDKAQAEYDLFAEQQGHLKESEGEQNITELLQWKVDPKDKGV